MPVYTVEQLVALKESDLVIVPEFKWNEIEKVPQSTNLSQDNSHHSTWRRGSHNSHNAKRPVVMPKAAIPFSQRALFDSNSGAAGQSTEATVEQEEAESDDDEFAARYLLKSKPKSKKSQEAEDENGAPVVNLTYAAALAASMKMSEAQGSNNAVEEPTETAEDGWVSVSHQNKPKRNRNKGSFSKWRV